MDHLPAAMRDATRNRLGDALARSVSRQPDAPALRFAEREWSYRELDRAANRVAHGLLALGLEKGDRVAAYGRNSDAYAILWLACTRAGLIHVPVNFSLVRDELSYICRQSGARALFCDDDLRASVDQVADDLPPGIGIGSLRASSPVDPQRDVLALARADAPDGPLHSAAQDDEVVQILYTSGTTSHPKGAMHTHRSLFTHYMACLLHIDIRERDRMLVALPLFHSGVLHVYLMPALLCGACTWLMEYPDQAQILEQIERHGITSFYAPPTLWIGLLRHPDFDRRDLSHLRHLYYGSSIMPKPIVAELGERLPHAGLFNLYGQTEIAPVATVLRPEEHAGRLTSCGRPITTVQTRVVNPETMEDCAPGEQGEIVHRSPQLMVGYWDKPDKTAEAFRGGWFHSGDLAYRDEEGFLYIVDRIKDVVNTGGVLVASRDVEEALYLHESVAEVAVIGLPHEKWVEAIAAIVVLRPGHSPNAQALNDHARAHLAPFKVPKSIFFVESLPKNASGKLLKRELRGRFGTG